MTRAVLVVALVLACGCAAKAGRAALTADRSIYVALSTVQDQITDLCRLGTVPAPGCVALNGSLVAALEAGDAFNRSARDGRALVLGDLVVAVGRLTTTIMQHVPGPARADLVVYLSTLTQTAFAEVTR